MPPLRSHLLLYAKGVAMGAADVVPGVSGGTIAFISGIYQTLLDSIRSVNKTALVLLISMKWKACWEHVNGTFLLVLLAGIATSILLFSRVILFLLSNHPIPLWSFFFGLIVASTLLVYRTIVHKKRVLVWIALLFGAVLAYFITSSAPTDTPEAGWFIFLSGAVAICAMILPGISGSFILLLLGKYEFILTALKQLNIAVLFMFMAGCVVGLLSFANALSWLLKRFHDVTVAVLTGFMVGSLYKVWPWKVAVETYINSKGVEKPLIEHNLFPWAYAQATGLAPQWALALVFLCAGFALVIGLDRAATRLTR